MLAAALGPPARREQRQLDSLAAEVDALTAVEALLQRYGTHDAGGAVGSAHSPDKYEQRQLDAIAQHDFILDAMQSQSQSQSKAQSSQQSPIDDAQATGSDSQEAQDSESEEDADLTFITQSVRSPPSTQHDIHAEQRDSVQSDTSDTAHCPPSPSAPQQAQQTHAQPVAWEAQMGDGEGFRLSASEAVRVADIDAILAALQSEEREGKKRRFVRVCSRASTQRVKASSDERRTSNLPSVSKPHSFQSRLSGSAPAPTASAASLSLSSTLSGAAGPSPLLADEYCVNERHRLTALDEQLASFAALQPLSDSGEEECDEWLPLEECSQQPELSAATVSNRTVRPRVPAEQSWLYVNRLRDLYPASDAHTQQLQSQRDDDDPFSWLDAVDVDGRGPAVEQLDRVIERNSILHDTDSEDDDDEAAQAQRTSGTAWQAVKALPAAPFPPDLLANTDQTDHSHVLHSPKAASAAASSSSSAGALEEALSGAGGATLAERERRAAASSEAARHRVKRLIAEAEERKQAVQSQQQQSPASVESGSGGSLFGRVARVRTSEERSSGTLQRKAASVLLSALPGRPPRGEAQ